MPSSSSIERAGLVAQGRGQVDHDAHAAQGVAERRRVGEVAEGDLHADAVGPEAARVAHEAADRRARRHEPLQEGPAHEPGGAGQQEHRRGSVPGCIG